MLLPDIVVIACNTASVTALTPIRAALSVPVVGVVPAVKPAAALTQTGAIAVLGTPATIRQDYLADLISNFAPDQDVLRIGSVDLVDIAESKLAGEPIDLDRVHTAVAPLHDRPDIDTVVLACTHFPLLIEELIQSVPSGITFIDSGEAIARRVESLLPKLTSNDAPDIAFSTGKTMSPARRQTLNAYGFPEAVALKL
jgi:glutamate racemase